MMTDRATPSESVAIEDDRRAAQLPPYPKETRPVYFAFLAGFFAAFLADFLAAFFVAMDRSPPLSRAD